MKKQHALRWLLRRIRARIPALAAVALLGAVSAVLGVLFALATRQVIDAAVSAHGGGDMAAFRDACLVEVAIICGMLVCSGLHRWLSQWLTCRLDRDWKQELLDVLLAGRYDALAVYHSGEVINRLNNDVRTVDEGLVSGLPGALSMAVRMIAALAVLAGLWPAFALALVGLGAVMIAATGVVRRRWKELYKRTSQSDGKVLSFFQEVVEKLLVVQAMDLSGEVRRRSDGLLEKRWGLQRRQRRISLLAGVGMNVCYYAAGLAVLVWCGWSLIFTGMSFGTMTAVMQLFDQLQSPFVGLSGFLPRYAALLASTERLMELEQVAPAGERRFCPRADSIEARSVTFGYEDDPPILRSASFTVPAGAFAAVTGRSGIGKSTILKLLLGVFRPREGTLTARNGQEEIPLSDGTRGLFAYVPQGNLLFSGTLKENLKIVRPDAGEDEIAQAAYVSAMDEFLSQLPAGLDTRLGERGEGLSEGQAQRLAIARAVLSGASVLLLDEATSALDAETERTVLGRIAALEGRTCIVVTHRPAALELADLRLDVTDEGEVRTEQIGGRP